jgi:very-short-patch-repair endonuclease
LRCRVNGRSESGQESVLRWWLDEAGLRYEIQVGVKGVGRIDFLVEGRLVVEADSKLAHSKWEQHLRDRNRDLALARLGLATLRPHYAAIMFNPESVLAAVHGLLARLR